MLLLALLCSAFAADPPPPPPPEVPVEPLPIVEMPTVAQYVEAPYPEAAQAEHLEGTVRLLVDIDDTGHVTAVTVEVPAGNGFDEAAVAAVQQMSFTPARTAEGPVPVEFEFDYGFVLKPETPVETPTGPTAEQPAEKPVNFEGLVREMGTRQVLEGVRIVIPTSEGDVVGETDAEGKFAIKGVPVGTWKARLLHPGHVALEQEITIAAGEVTTANLWIRAEQYRENESVGVYRKEEQEVTRRTITIDEVRQIPGTFGDPVKVVQTLPGAARSPFGTGFLIIRGSNPEDSGVYVDGVRIPIIYHLTGTTSVLSPDLIESVDYLPGGYGAQYGRSMGGVVDIKTKEKFERDKLMWGTDILDSQIYFEGNVGKKGHQHGIAIGARRSYIDAFLPLFMKGDFFIKPRYWDYQVKWIPPTTGDRHFSAFVYGFDDVLTVQTAAGVAQGPDQDTQGDFRTEYLSHRGVIQFEQPFGDTFKLRLIPSLGYDYGVFGLGNQFSLESWNQVAELRAETPWKPSEAFELVPGLDFIGGIWKFKFVSPFRFTDLNDPLNEREAVTLDGHGTAWAPDFYVKANLRPLADRDRLLLTPALRSDLMTFTYKGSITGSDGAPPYTITALDPRLLGRFEAVDGLTFKASSGLYNQPPQPMESVGVGTRAVVGFERSWATSVGVEHQVTPAVQWDLELFYKDMRDLIVFNDNWTGTGDVDFINKGSGNSYGLEVIVRHAKTDRFFGWVSYTLSRARRCDYPWDQCYAPGTHPEGKHWYPFEFDQPHIFSAQGGYDLPYDFSVSAQVQYVSGNPDTPYNAGVYDVDADVYNPFRIGTYDSERLPSFFQTSIRLDRLWTFKRWQLSTYVDLMNIVRGVNPEVTIYAYDYTEHAYVRGLPFIPNIGVEARFYP